MSTTAEWDAALGSDLFGSFPSADQEVVELPILLPEWQISALEAAARRRGMTVGQMVRRLFADLFPHPVEHAR